MGNAGAIRAGRAFVEVYADKTALMKQMRGLSSDLRTAGAGVMTLGGGLAAAGAAIAAPMMLAANSFAKMGSQLYDMAARTGMSTETLSELAFAAEQTGSSIETVETGARKLQKSIFAAATGSKEQAEAFKQMGLSVSDLQSLKPDEQFALVGERIAAIADPTTRAAMAMTLFGKSGTALLPMLADMKGLREEAQRLGFTMSKEDAEAADALGDALDKQKRSLKSVAIAVGTALAPLLTKLANIVVEVVNQVRLWVKEHPALIQNIFKAALLVGGLGTALVFLGGAMKVVGGVLGAATKATGIFAAMFGIVLKAALLLMNPFVLLGAAVLGVAAYFLYTSGVAGKAISWIGSAFSNLVSEVTGALGVIAESMSVGDFASAAAVGWALIKLEWTKGVNFLEGLWESYKQWYVEVTYGFLSVMNDIVAGIKTLWAEMIGWLAKKWQAFTVSGFTEGLANLLAPIIALFTGVSEEEIKKNLKEDFERGRKALPTKQADIDAATKAKKDQIEKDRKAAEEDMGADLSARQKARDAKAKAAQAEVDAARKALDDAKKSAADKAAAARAKQAEEQGAVAPPGELDFATAGAGGQRGTFSATAVSGLGVGGGLLGRIAKATEDQKTSVKQVATNTQKIFEQLTQTSWELSP